MLHGSDVPLGDLPAWAVRTITARQSHEPVGRTTSRASLEAALDGAITAKGLGAERARVLFDEVVSANTVALDGPRFLAFIPMAPSAAAVWIDAVVSATSFSAESWLEAAGAVAAENQTLNWLAGLAGMPEGAGGAFCSGGSIGNLSALAVARDAAGGRRLCAVADTAHASVDNSLRLLGFEALEVPTGADGVFTADALRQALAASGRAGDLALVVASAGSTNAGVVDDLRGLAEVAHEHDAWLHVDGAYGGAALVLPERRHLFDGLGEADSFIVDPHKWLFSTAGSCALLYRRPELAALTHRQKGPYIDVLHTAGTDAQWNPSDYAYQLTRRASGLPLWFTLAVHGTEAMAAAVRVAVDLAAYARDRLATVEGVEVLNDPQLSVLLFKKHGWDAQRWGRWASELLAAEIAFVAPTTWKGESVGRLVFLHPRTTTAIVDEVVDTLR